MRFSIILILFISYIYGDMFEFFEKRHGVEVIPNKVYEEECGSCHIAYQPGLLPKRSWLLLMQPSALEDHFGDNAALEEETRADIEKYLVDHSAETSSGKRSRKILSSLRIDESPLRITEVRYIERKHDEIPKRLIVQKEVKSLSYCNKCHKKAEKGIYDDDSVFIPNYGRWDD